MKIINLVILICISILISSCATEQETQTKEIIQEIKFAEEKIRAGDKNWVKNNFDLLVQCNDYLKEVCDSWEVKRGYTNMYKSLFSLLSKNDANKDVIKIVVEILKLGNKENKLVSDLVDRNLSEKEQLEQHLLLAKNKIMNFSGNRNYLKFRMCYIAENSDWSDSVSRMEELIKMADFNAGKIRCYEKTRCPMSLRRVSGEAFGSATNSRIRCHSSGSGLDLSKDSYERCQSEERAVNNVKDMHKLLDKINRWDIGSCSTKRI